MCGTSTVVACRFGSVTIRVCGVLAHSVGFRSSVTFKSIKSKSISRSVTICSYVRFSKWIWLLNFFRCGGTLSLMNCSLPAWAATLNASFANFRNSFKKSIRFRFTALKIFCYNLCFALTINCGFKVFSLIHSQDFSQVLSIWSCDVFARL